jgi:phosphoglycolate phosphatase-like HAD superfamily hydrolase
MTVHLVWDWNGTLLDDLELTIAATNASLAAVGGPLVTTELHRRAFRRPLIDYYSQMLGRQISAAEFGVIDVVFGNHYRSGVERCPLATDALDALNWWQGSQSLLSMWRHSELMKQLRSRELTSWLARADGCRNYDLGDRKAAYLVEHLAALDIAGDRCVLIGDTVDDAAAAEAVGSRCVLYTGGITDPQALHRTGHPVASSLMEAVNIASTGRG